jgi:hypothetical protein
VFHPALIFIVDAIVDNAKVGNAFVAINTLKCRFNTLSVIIYPQTFVLEIKQQ